MPYGDDKHYRQDMESGSRQLLTAPVRPTAMELHGALHRDTEKPTAPAATLSEGQRKSRQSTWRHHEYNKPRPGAAGATAWGRPAAGPAALKPSIKRGHGGPSDHRPAL